jgi:hypothetical protein
MKSNFKFDLLVLDTEKKSDVQSEVNLLHSLLSNGSLWKAAVLDQSKLKINDGKTKILINQVSPEDDTEEKTKAFLIKVESEYDWLEPNRTVILAFLRKQNFDYLYVLIDEISEQIAIELYPLIYQVENLLRAYIVKFMTTRLGPKWWDITATNELNKKVQQRKNNEKVFAEYIDNKAYLIDFGELGEIIYSHSSGFTSKEDILKKITELEETTEAIKLFKEELKSNYQKFFKESFSDKKFQEKWEKLEKIRHKVAHNSLFTDNDLVEGKEISENLIEIIKTAIESIDKVTLRLEEKEAIQKSFGFINDISEDIFIDELQKAEQHYSKFADGFVGLSKFVENLEAKGFHRYSTKKVIEKLEFESKIEVYHEENPFDRANPVAAIKVSHTS